MGGLGGHWETFSFNDWRLYCELQHCWHQCSNHRGLHTAIQWQWAPHIFGTDGRHHWTSDGNGVLSLIIGPLHRKHNAHCCSTRFCNWNEFTNSDGTVQRFLMRGIFMKGGKHHQCNQEYNRIGWWPQCSLLWLLFPNRGTTIGLETLDIIQEWHIVTTLPLQLFLEWFLNQQTLSTMEVLHKYLQNRVYKLYTHVDGLVSVHSNKYSGILEDLNTKELAKKCHSITLLFTIARKTGATQSLHTAETPLKQEADSDLCYFNTYLRKYSMKYISVAGKICQEIRVRDCQIIIGLDNLVRLIFHPDPMPGQSRSHQVNTLPITIFRVPTDAYITLSWHSEHCDGLEECSCMDVQSLKPDG